MVVYNQNNVNYLYNVGTPTARVRPSPLASGNLTLLSSFIVNSVSYTVTSIDNESFSGCSNLVSISIPDSITNIGDFAFWNCSSLITASLPSNLSFIVSGMFYNCTSLQSVTIPNTVTEIGGDAFIGVAMTTITIPPSVTFIGARAFNGASQLSVVNFNHITTLPGIGLNAFQNIASQSVAYVKPTVTNKSTLNPYFTTVEYFEIPCFKEGTKILTDKGYIEIQHLRNGDLIQTLLSGLVPINMIGKSDMHNPEHNERIEKRLYKCTRENYPELFEELVITGCHSILVDAFVDNQEEETKAVLKNIYVTDRKYRLPACVDKRAELYEKSGLITIYHLALDNADYYMNYGIYANGLAVETTSQRWLKEYSNMTLL